MTVIEDEKNEQLEGAKPALKSIAIHGGLGAIVSGVWALCQLPAWEAELVVPAVGSIIGGVLAIVGRARAEKVIRGVLD